MQISEKEFKSSAKRLVKALDIELKHQTALQVLSQSLFGVSFEQAKATLLKEDQSRDDISFFAIDTGSSLILCNSKGEYCDRGDYFNKSEYGDLISHFEHHAWSFNESLPVVIDMPEYLQGIFQDLDCDDELIPICVTLGIIECDKPSLFEDMQTARDIFLDGKRCINRLDEDWERNIAEEGMTGILWSAEILTEQNVTELEYYFCLEDFINAEKVDDKWIIPYPVSIDRNLPIDIEIVKHD